jgi:hypothetical protein
MTPSTNDANTASICLRVRCFLNFAAFAGSLCPQGSHPTVDFARPNTIRAVANR